ncbi:MAG: translocation/assembly module TamB domain-containing protein [Saprospiraceae bacterium]
MVKNSLENNDSPTNPVKEKKKRSRTYRWVRRLIYFLLLVIFLPVLLFQIPKVQNLAADELTKFLSNEMGTVVSIDRVKLNVFYEIRLEKLYIEDLQGDTLLYTGLLDVDHTGLHHLLNNEIQIESVTLDDTRVTISREEGQEFKNFQFLINYFTPTKKDKPIDRESSPFIFQLKHLLLTNIHFHTPDAVKGETIDVSLDRLEAYINNFDLLEKNIEIESLDITGTTVVLDQYVRKPLPDSTISQLVTKVETTSKDTLRIAVKDLQLLDGAFKFSNRRKEPVKLSEDGILNFNHLDVYDVNFHFTDFEMNNELEFKGRVQGSSLKERNGFVLENLAAEAATLNCLGLSLFEMELRTPHTVLGDTLLFRYDNYYDWESFPDNVKMDLRFSEEAYVSLKDIMTFAPGLENNPFFKENKNEEVNITGRIKGPVNRLDGRNLKINLAGGVRIEGNFSTINLTVKDEQFVHLELDRLQTKVKTLRKLIPGFTPPENFNRLGNLDFSGNFDGFFVDFVADGFLKTDIGTASMDANMKLRGGRETALYSGDLQLNNFNLGVWTDNKDFGKISFSTSVKEGVGLTLNSAEAKLSGRIDSLNFKNYIYSNVQLDGELKKNLFNGDLVVEDKNINLKFGGEVNFTDSIPAFDFKTDIKQLAIKKLNLSEKDLQFSGKAALKLKGKRLSDIVGDAEVTDFQVVKNQTDTLYLDKAVVASTLSEMGDKHFQILSNLGNVDINGRFDIEKIPNTFVSYLQKNYERFAKKLKLDLNGPTLDSMQFDYTIELFELQNLVNFFDEKINGFDETRIKGAYDGVEGLLELEMEIPNWSYEKISFDDVYVRAKLNEEDGSLQLGVVETELNSGRKLSPISMIGTLYSDTMEFLVISSNFFKILDNININGVLSLEPDEAWRVSFKPSDLVILNQMWNIDTTNYIRIGEGKVQTKNFRLHNEDQLIVLKSFQDEGLELQIRNVPLESVDVIRNIEKLSLAGLANLDVQAKNVFKLQGLSSFLQIKDLTVNGDNYGTLQLNAKTNSIEEELDAGLSIIGDTTKLNLKGFVNLPTYKTETATAYNNFDKNHFDFNIDLENIPIKIINYFVPEVENPSGFLSAQNIRMYGPFDRPELDGRAFVKDVSFKVKPIQTTYRVPEGSVVLTSRAIDATGSFVLDRDNNKAFLTGGLVHDHFRDFGVDLTITTAENQPFLGLDTKETDNATFYGTAYGTGMARFTGSFKQTDLEVRGRSMPGTHMYLPLTSSTISSDNRFIRFTEEDRKKENQNDGETVVEEPRGLNMSYYLELTPDALMEVIFDKAWGDVLSGTGEGEVSVFLKRDGDFKMYGDVSVVSGDYLFTLMNLGVNKPFEVAPGGTIKWSGDPYNADIKIDAIYSGVNASVYNLIQEYLSVASTATQDLARSSTPVLLEMNLSGKLLTPDIKFDITFPQLDSELKSFAENKLRATRSDENELNRQVFGLLVLGQFLPSGSSIQAGDVGLNTLSEMISNQLSIFVTEWVSELVSGTNFIKGIDVNISVNRFTTEDLATADLSTSNEVSTRFKVKFSDRVSFNIGGQYGLNNSVSTINTGQWAGEFEVETVLTKDRRLVFKAYSTTDPDLTGGRRNKYGGKIVFRKEFDSVKELFRK